MDKALAYAEENFDGFVTELKELLRIPSVSTNPDHVKDVRWAADWLSDHLKSLGIEKVEVMETAGHPVVYAESVKDPSLPTLLVYGHYDVQPPDPLELWDSPPFEPVVKDGVLYARGSCDDKGQLFMHLKAAESYLRTGGALPLSVKYIFEGEEENGSENLPAFIEANKELLSADVVVISDTALFGSGVPSITYGLRGLAYVEVTLTGPDRDLHSGVYGGAIENPVNVLARMISALHDDDYRVTIPGFYDDVIPLTDEERTTFASLPFDDQEWIEEVGVTKARTETGYSILEGTTARPTLDCNGIWGGYIGDGAKTVLPSKASVKISMRLVPDQSPEDITEKLKKYFEYNTPPTMKLTYTELHGGERSPGRHGKLRHGRRLRSHGGCLWRETVLRSNWWEYPHRCRFQETLGLGHGAYGIRIGLRCHSLPKRVLRTGSVSRWRSIHHPVHVYLCVEVES